MRRILFIILLASLCSDSVYSQVIQGSKYFKDEFGVKVGLDYQTIIGKPWTPKYNSGILFGVYKDYMRHKSGLRIECNFIQAHYTTVHPAVYLPLEPTNGSAPDTIQKGDFNVFYLQIPILAEFKIYKSIYFLMGPGYSQQLSISDNNGAFSKDYSKKGGLNSIFTTAELMGNIGLEAKLKQRINFGFRFSFGLTGINKGASSETENNFRVYDRWKIWSLQATFGFRLKSNY